MDIEEKLSSIIKEAMQALSKIESKVFDLQYTLSQIKNLELNQNYKGQIDSGTLDDLGKLFNFSVEEEFYQVLSEIHVDNFSQGASQTFSKEEDWLYNKIIKKSSSKQDMLQKLVAEYNRVLFPDTSINEEILKYILYFKEFLKENSSVNSVKNSKKINLYRIPLCDYDPERVLIFDSSFQIKIFVFVQLVDIAAELIGSNVRLNTRTAKNKKHGLYYDSSFIYDNSKALTSFNFYNRIYKIIPLLALTDIGLGSLKDKLILQQGDIDEYFKEIKKSIEVYYRTPNKFTSKSTSGKSQQMQRLLLMAYLYCPSNILSEKLEVVTAEINRVFNTGEKFGKGDIHPVLSTFHYIEHSRLYILLQKYI